MQRWNGSDRSNFALGLLLAGLFAAAGCHSNRSNDRADNRRGDRDARAGDWRGGDVREDRSLWTEERVVIRDARGADHHGYYDRQGSWHGGYYDDKHDFHNDAADWAHGQERSARREGSEDQYDRNGRDKQYAPDRQGPDRAD